MTRIALIGLGAMGQNHLRVLSDLDDVELVAICDQDAEIIDAAASNHSLHPYTSWDEMLDREKLDAAIIAVPTRFHLAAGLAALKHGLHVLVEKPIAANLQEGRQLVAAAKRAGRILGVGHIERFNPAVRELQRRVSAGEIGRLFQLQARRLGPFPARIRDVGVVIDLATHDLDVMDHLAASEVQRLYAETEQRIHTDHEDILNALLKFESGVLGVLQVNWLTPTKIRELTVLGERGLFVCNYLTQELTHYKNADVLTSAEARRQPRAVTEGESVTLPIVQAEPLKLELQAFLQAVRGEQPLDVDGEAGLRALHLALALVTSASESRVFLKDDLGRLWDGETLGIGSRKPGGAHSDDL
ncbi:MAG TPA: Gfo/Idh/MocA family oxidoreductase [Candidatus Dormibacteraeota bacterium]|jgi:predicted dehydrogenase|nr:Gfo/Idh/MocA family oxidoreductase [Candidatus Dormibacteraeota bacterium]